VHARGQVGAHGVGDRRGDAPFVDEDAVVHVEAHAVIDRDVEAVGAGREIDVAGPPGGEVIGRELAVGRAPTPVEVEVGIGAHENRAAGEILAGKVLAAPGGIGRGRNGRGGCLGQQRQKERADEPRAQAGQRDG